MRFINLDFVRETAFSIGGFGVRYGDRISSVLTLDLQDGRMDAIGGKGTISASQFGFNLQGPVASDGSFSTGTSLAGCHTGWTGTIA